MWSSIRESFSITKALVDARCKRNLTQKELAQITGIRQSNISRIERGDSSPNLSTLQKLAEGLEMVLQVRFVEKGNL
ncbi:MAG: helix-turn-helix transcriptional regulator [Hespellia sp.]|nr:helix-turn-helix transcriptional regulator [Hespellia sp.]